MSDAMDAPEQCYFDISATIDEDSFARASQALSDLQNDINKLSGAKIGEGFSDANLGMYIKGIRELAKSLENAVKFSNELFNKQREVIALMNTTSPTNAYDSDYYDTKKFNNVITSVTREFTTNPKMLGKLNSELASVMAQLGISLSDVVLHGEEGAMEAILTLVDIADSIRLNPDFGTETKSEQMREFNRALEGTPFADLFTPDGAYWGYVAHQPNRTGREGFSDFIDYSPTKEGKGPAAQWTYNDHYADLLEAEKRKAQHDAVKTAVKTGIGTTLLSELNSNDNILGLAQALVDDVYDKASYLFDSASTTENETATKIIEYGFALRENKEINGAYKAASKDTKFRDAFQLLNGKSYDADKGDWFASNPKASYNYLLSEVLQGFIMKESSLAQQMNEAINEGKAWKVDSLLPDYVNTLSTYAVFKTFIDSLAQSDTLYATDETEEFFNKLTAGIYEEYLNTPEEDRDAFLKQLQENPADMISRYITEVLPLPFVGEKFRDTQFYSTSASKSYKNKMSKGKLKDYEETIEQQKRYLQDVLPAMQKEQQTSNNNNVSLLQIELTSNGTTIGKLEMEQGKTGVMQVDLSNMTAIVQGG